MASPSRPPTQYLVLDVLAARTRLGDPTWTFPNSVRPALKALAADGLVGYKSAPIGGHQLAWLTEAGRPAAISNRHRPGRDWQQVLKLGWAMHRAIRRGDDVDRWAAAAGWDESPAVDPRQPDLDHLS